MRRRVLGVGLLLILAGFYVVDQGTEILIPVAAAFGLVTHTQTQTAILAPTLLRVAPMNYTFMPINLNGGARISGALEVGEGREIAFFVMNEENFSEWRAGRPSRVILAKPFTISYNFTFTPNVDGAYYFVFDNVDNSRRVVLFTLNVVRDVVVLNPAVAYSGYEMLLVGLLLSALAIKSGGRNHKGRRIVVEWRCKFCGFKNPSGETFCAKCGRSQR